MKKSLFFILIAYQTLQHCELEISKDDQSMPTTQAVVDSKLLETITKKKRFIFKEKTRSEKYIRLAKELDPEVRKAFIQNHFNTEITNKNLESLHQKTIDSINKLQKNYKGLLRKNENYSATLMKDLKNLEKNLRNTIENKQKEPQAKDTSPKRSKKNLENQPLNPFIKPTSIEDLKNTVKDLQMEKLDLNEEKAKINETVDQYQRAITWQNDLKKGALNQLTRLTDNYEANFFTPDREAILSANLVSMQKQLNDLNSNQNKTSTNLLDAINNVLGRNEHDSYNQKINLSADIAKVQKWLADFDEYNSLTQRIQDSNQKIQSLTEEQQDVLASLKNINQQIAEKTNQEEHAKKQIALKPKKEAALKRFEALTDLEARQSSGKA